MNRTLDFVAKTDGMNSGLHTSDMNEIALPVTSASVESYEINPSRKKPLRTITSAFESTVLRTIVVPEGSECFTPRNLEVYSEYPRS